MTKNSTIFNKRACLASLPGSSKLSPQVVKGLRIPLFLANLPFSSWKTEEAVVVSYHDFNENKLDKVDHFMAVLVGSLRKMIGYKQLDAKVVKYCIALIQQYSSENSKNRVAKKFKKIQKEKIIEENEEEANLQAKMTSRLLITIESINH